MRQTKNKLKTNLVINISILIFSLYSFLYCLYNDVIQNKRVYLWILPLAYFIFFILFKTNRKYYKNIGIAVINIVALIRFTIIPISYYKSYYWGINYNNFEIPIFLMVLELFCVFLTIAIFAPIFFGKKIVNINKKLSCNLENRVIGISVFIVFIITPLILFKYPQLLIAPFNFNQKSLVASDYINGAFVLFYKSFLVIFTLYILVLIKNSKNEKISVKKIFISLLAIIVFLLEISFRGTGSISRWQIVINGLILFSILKRFYPKHTMLVNLLIILLVLLVLIATYYKFSYNVKYSFDIKYIIKNLFDYQTLNAYFSGPSNIEIALKTKELFRNNIDAKTFINDILGNFPLINHYIGIGNNITPFYFNYTFYNSTVATDQICPIIGQGYIYFGLLFAPLLSVFATILVMILNKLVYRTRNLIIYYGAMFATISTALFMCINMNIIFQFIWIDVLPLFIIGFCNLKIK